MNHRFERAQRSVHQHLAELVPWSVKDPRVHAVEMVTITAIRLSPDYRNARVIVSIKSDDQVAREQAISALRKAAPYLRRELGGRLRLKNTPALDFQLDDVPERVERLEQILEEIAAEREAQEGDEGPAGTVTDGKGDGDP